MDANSDALILDLRWQEVYDAGHFRGAILIDSSLSEAIQHSLAQSEIDKRDLPYNHTIISLCNCPDGHFARDMETYLQKKGFFNTYYLGSSFSLWQDPRYLVKGSTPSGVAQVTQIGSDFRGEVSNPLNDLGFLLLITALVGVGAYFVYYTTKKPINTEKLQQTIAKSDIKKEKELQSIKDIVSSKTGEKESQKKTITRRRR